MNKDLLAQNAKDDSLFNKIVQSVEFLNDEKQIPPPAEEATQSQVNVLEEQSENTLKKGDDEDGECKCGGGEGKDLAELPTKEDIAVTQAEKKKELTLEEIEKLKAEAGEGDDGGGGDLYWTGFGWYRVPESVPRDLGIFWQQIGEYKLFLPPPILELVETGEIPPPHECIPPELHDDCNKVFESGLCDGSDKCNPKPTLVMGNVLGNDVLPEAATITQVEFEGDVYVPDQNGVIRIITDHSVFLLYTQEFTDILGPHVPGDYFYKLFNNVEHPCDQGHNKIEEVYTYTVKNVDCPDSAKADLTIKIVDDVPCARDDPTVCLKGCDQKASGNVLCNDKPGADNPIRVKSITYDNCTKSVDVPENGSVTVQTSIGGKLTVFSNGNWCYESPDACGNKCELFLLDGFKYTITDTDCDESTASQKINILLPAGPDANDDCNIVYESGLPCGSDHQLDPCNVKNIVAEGNLLANDCFEGKICITEICFNGQVYKPDQNGLIHVQTENGNLVVFTKEVGTGQNHHDAGDYVYTLEDNAQHPGDAGRNIIEEEFKYTIESKGDDCRCDDSAVLTIKIVDDVPKAKDDCPVQVEKCDKVCGNVLTNDIKGADKPIHVACINYNNGANSAIIPESGHISVTTLIGALLTVYSNGSWSYEAPKLFNSECDVQDGFTYKIADSDNDLSSADQPILVKASYDCDPPVCSLPPCDEPPVCTPPVDCHNKPPCDDKPPVCDNKPCDKPPVCDDKPCDPQPPACDTKPCEPPPCQDKPPACDDKPCDDKPCEDKPPVSCDNDDRCDQPCDDKHNMVNGRREHCDKDKKDCDEKHANNDKCDSHSKHEDCDIQKLCGNVKDHCDDSYQTLKILGFKYFNDRNECVDAKCEEEVTMRSGAKFVMHQNGDYEHTQHGNNSFEDHIIYKTNNDYSEKNESRFSIHTEDKKPDFKNHDNHGKNEKYDSDDYLVNARDAWPKMKISMDDVGIRCKEDNDHPRWDKPCDPHYKEVCPPCVPQENSHSGSSLPLVYIEQHAAMNHPIEQHIQVAQQECCVIK